ncbi:hypothetical protein LPJ59_000225 [Coemansia sp. RSA 2399]|nr:hypothetical protein LPJ59_000225 [Coemansia sp. RSA 2399]KAJ1908288.1 hypothetical protein LPJ81_000199 [Coemansia sp. IMI 209127]
MTYTALDLFTYEPVKVAPEIAASLFALAAIVLTILIVKTLSARWMYILVGTAISESIGYILRAVCTEHTSLGLFVCMTLLLLLPPNALALFNYKTIGEISRISYDPDRKFWLKPRFITWFFFSSDVFSFLLQSSGAAMTATSSTKSTGKWICIIGLAVQLVFLAAFTFIAVVIHRSPLYKVTKGPKDGDERVAKRRVMWVVLGTTVLLYVRSIYRLIEFIDGYGGKIYSAEWAFYVFDYVPIFSMFLIYIVFFIGYNFPRYGVSGRGVSL